MILRTALLVLCLLGVSCKGIQKVTVPFYQSPVPSAPDYSSREHWAALPDKRDAADSVPLMSSLKDAQATADADVFFVYPTIFTGKPNNAYAWNASLDDAVLNERIQTSTILNQATIFNGTCRVYAPYYRQAHLYAFYTAQHDDGTAALSLAYEDVKAAFQYYLDHYNQGRPIVIASHSQGSYHTQRLIKEFFDGKDLRKQLVMAYLVGRAIPTDAFDTIHPSASPEETGVWASWNTFAYGFIPRNYDRYYTRALSTNPLTWNSKEDPAGKEMNTGGVGLHFTMYPQLVDAQNHRNLLWIHKPYVKGRMFLRQKIWHRADMNFFYMNVRDNVALRVSQFQRQSR